MEALEENENTMSYSPLKRLQPLWINQRRKKTGEEITSLGEQLKANR